MEELSDKPCKSFSKYKGLRKPKCGCLPCRGLYEEVQESVRNISEDVHKAYEDENKTKD